MADDGMLVNFDIGDGPLTVKPTFKGGNWRDRLKAKKTSNRPQNVTSETSTSSDKVQSLNGSSNGVRIPAEDGDHRAAKRRRLSSGTQRRERGGDDRTESKPHQVVSSLFTFNPTPKAVDGHSAKSTAESTAEPSNAPLKDDLETFTSLGVTKHLAEHLLRKLEIKAPTSIQKSAIAQLLKEETDAFIQAETGSGKTLAYLLPIVQRLMSLKASDKKNEDTIHRDSGLFALVLAPTRELGKQIAAVLESLLRCAHWIVSGTVIGGEKKKSEKARLRKGLNVLIATPGRLVDHLDSTKVLDLTKVRWLVLDEGDRLMELGFEQDIRKILSKLDAQRSSSTDGVGLPERRTNILCSATLKTNVGKLGDLSLNDAVHIQATEMNVTSNGTHEAREDDVFSAPAQLQQSYAIVPAKQRLVALAAVLKRAFARKGSVMKAMVFLSCADSVDFHFEVFSRINNAEGHVEDHKTSKITNDALRAQASCTIFSNNTSTSLFRLHGSLPQALRTSTLRAFSRSKDPAILLCTDVASRGLDLPNVDLVIEFDPPFTRDDHLHRIGRTARAGRDGRALIFLLPGAEEGYLPILKALHNRSHDPSTARQLVYHDAAELLRRGFTDADAKPKSADWEARATEWQLEAERWTLENPRALEQARRAYQSHVRAYATHAAAERQVFDIGGLHLGHLAKAFALRDRPGNMRIPGVRGASEGVKKGKSGKGAPIKGAAGGKRKAPTAGQDAGGSADTSTEEAARMMRAKAKMSMSGADEFNLG